MTDDAYDQAIRERDAMRARLAHLERRLAELPPEPEPATDWVRSAIAASRKPKPQTDRLARRLGFVVDDSEGDAA